MIQDILNFINKYAPLLIAFFLWRIAAHLKAIRKHIAGRMLYDTVRDVINLEKTIKQNKKEEVDKDEAKNT